MLSEIKLSIIGAIGTTTSIFAVVSDQVILAILTLIGTAITAGVTVVIALKGTNRKLDDLKESTDGKLTELMKATSRADLAEGRAEGKAEQKLETAAEAGAQTTRAESPTTSQPDTKINVKLKGELKGEL